MSNTPEDLEAMARAVVDQTGRSYTKVRAFLQDIDAMCKIEEAVEQAKARVEAFWDTWGPPSDVAFDAVEQPTPKWEPPASHTPTEAESISGVELGLNTLTLTDEDWPRIESALNSNGYFVSRNVFG